MNHIGQIQQEKKYIFQSDQFGFGFLILQGENDEHHESGCLLHAYWHNSSLSEDNRDKGGLVIKEIIVSCAHWEKKENFSQRAVWRVCECVFVYV